MYQRYIQESEICIHTSTVLPTRPRTLSKSRVSTASAVAVPPASLISRSTVLMVDWGELGSGGNGDAVAASLVVFAATTTIVAQCGSLSALSTLRLSI